MRDTEKTRKQLINDIAELRRDFNLLQQSEKSLKVKLKTLDDRNSFHQTLLNTLPFGMDIVDEDGHILFQNSQFENFLGQEVIGKKCWEVYKDDRAQCKDCPLAGSIALGETHSLDVDQVLGGRTFHITHTGFRYKGKKVLLEIFQDITEKRKMEEEILKTRKLESIAVLAGGIAHDFNNILTGVIGNISLAKFHVESESDLSAILDEAERAALRAKGLTQQLLTFSKGGAPVKKTTSIVKLLRENICINLRGSTVKCSTDITEDLWAVNIDEAQMNQVIDNLVINAQHSMPEGGLFTVGGKNITMDNVKDFPLAKGKYVKLIFQDVGRGIPQKNMNRIFDPFFTTKAKGSGLGLSTTFSIVQKHDGHIQVESEVGVGTRFTIYLPASDEVIPGKIQKPVHPYFGTGNILLVDDDEIVRNTAGRLLGQLGYDVSFANDGDQAIDLYRKAHNTMKPFDAVIVDLTIPGGMGGRKAFSELKKINPQVKTIISSGYSNDPVLSDYKQIGFSAVVTKPYRLHELSQTLHFVLKR